MTTQTMLETALFDMECHPGLRIGQALWNVAYRTVGPPKMNPYVGGEFDPFYHDDRVRAFLGELEKIVLGA